MTGKQCNQCESPNAGIIVDEDKGQGCQGECKQAHSYKSAQISLKPLQILCWTGQDHEHTAILGTWYI